MDKQDEMPELCKLKLAIAVAKSTRLDVNVPAVLADVIEAAQDYTDALYTRTPPTDEAREALHALYCYAFRKNCPNVRTAEDLRDQISAALQQPPIPHETLELAEAVAVCEKAGLEIGAEPVDDAFVEGLKKDAQSSKTSHGDIAASYYNQAIDDLHARGMITQPTKESE